MAYLRGCAANEDDLTAFSRGFQHSVISAANELRAIRKMAEFAKTKLATYPTQIEEDTARLAGDELDPFSNERHAIIVIRGEKEILHFYVALADAAAKVLSLEPSQRKQVLRDQY